MLWVVTGHSSLYDIESTDNPYWEITIQKIAYSFHMALFIFVSGYLFHMTRIRKPMPYGKMIVDKLERLGIPFIVFTLLAMLLKVLVSSEMSRQTTFSIMAFINAIVYPYDGPMREMWFVATIFWLFALRPLWMWSLRSKWSVFVMGLVLFVLHFVAPDIQLFCFGRVLKYSIWFYAGVVAEHYCWLSRVSQLVETERNWGGGRILLCHLVCIGIYALLRIWNPDLGGLNSFLQTLFAIMASISLAFILDKYIPKAFFSFRNYTYQIFLMGIFAQIAVKISYRHIEMPYIVGYVLCLLAGLYVPVLISKLIEKINWKPLSLCVGLKTKQS